MSNSNVKKLVDLVRKNSTDPTKNYIERLVPEEELSKYEHPDILSAAQELGCIITKCLNHDFYKVNNIWLTPSKEALNRFKDYSNISHGYCDPCGEEFKREIEALYGKKNKRKQ